MFYLDLHQLHSPWYYGGGGGADAANDGGGCYWRRDDDDDNDDDDDDGDDEDNDVYKAFGKKHNVQRGFKLGGCTLFLSTYAHEQRHVFHVPKATHPSENWPLRNSIPPSQSEIHVEFDKFV